MIARINKEFYKDYLAILQSNFQKSKMIIAYCKDNFSGEVMAVLCSAEDDPKDNKLIITPYAKLFTSNPFDLMLPLSDTDDAIIVKQDEIIDIIVNNNLFGLQIKYLERFN